MPTRLRDPLGLFTVESDCDSLTNLSGRKDEVTSGVVAECAPVGPMYASNLDERNRAEEFARRPVLEHVLRQTMIRKLQQARIGLKPGQVAEVRGGRYTAENAFGALRGTAEVNFRADTKGGGHGYWFKDPELGVVSIRYKPDGSTRIEIGSLKWAFPR
jgi:hypothetical protein